MATVATLAVAVCLLALSGVVVLLAGMVLARHRAEAAADLSALSATARAGEGQRLACQAAAEAARLQRVRLTSCRVAGARAVVEVALDLPGRLALLGPLRATATSGPHRRPQ